MTVITKVTLMDIIMRKMLKEPLNHTEPIVNISYHRKPMNAVKQLTRESHAQTANTVIKQKSERHQKSFTLKDVRNGWVTQI